MSQTVCPNCGQANRAGAKYCSKCRAQLPAPPPPPPSVPPVTPPVQSSAEPFSATAVTPSPKRHLWLWGAVVLVALLIIGVLAFLFWPSGEENVAMVPETPTAETVEAPQETATADIPPTEQPTTIAEATPTPTIEPTSEIELITTPSVPVVNLLTNGNFVQNWDVGWTRTLDPAVVGPQRTEVTNVGQGASGRGLHIEQSGPDQLTLEQSIMITNPANMQFSAEVKLAGFVNSDTGAEGLGALMLIYRGEDQSPLGHSIWVSGEQRSSPLFGIGSLPPVSNSVSRRWLGSDWQPINIDVRQEIINSLPTVNPDMVRSITVMFLAAGSDNCMPDECPVDIQAVDLVLSSE